MAKQDEKIDKMLASVFGIVQNIRENMVTKIEFEEYKSNIFSHIDGFVKLHETLD